jgi:hypothetical protein
MIQKEIINKIVNAPSPDEVESVNALIKEANALIENCKNLDKELAAMKHGLDFLLNEYKTNKRYFREKPGRVTIEDVIKTCFEFGWASKSQFDYTEKNGIQEK